MRHLCLPEPCGHLWTHSSSCAVYGPLMLLSHALQQPTQRLHVSLQLLALIKHSRRETEKVEVFLFLSHSRHEQSFQGDPPVYTIPVGLCHCL